MNPVSTIFGKAYPFGLKKKRRYRRHHPGGMAENDQPHRLSWHWVFFLLRQVMTSQLYDSVLRLLNFMVSLRRLPPLSELSGDEERMLFELRVLWEKQGALSVADVYGLGIKQSDSTSYRQLIALKNKGLLAISVAEVDKRRRDVIFTKTAEDLFSVIG
jgi:hypothetical protein